MTSAQSLNVQNSLMKARWILPEADQNAVERLARKHNLPELIARLLVLRGVPDDKAQEFLFPTLKEHFPDPFEMAGMSDFADDIAEAIIAEKKIGIFGDFDVDGATSTALFLRFFRHLGIDAPFYIPDRIEEGYGPNVSAFKALKEQGVECVLICDCGVTAFDVLAEGKKMGLHISVLDHHEPEATLPDIDHIIDPKRADDGSGLDMLAACGVVFMACVAINKALREKNYFEKMGVSEVPLKNWLDLVGLGTVCDMVPLTRANRLFVRYGFKQMASRQNQGIKALLEVAKIEKEPNTYHAGFALGPRINAGSRIHRADMGARLLATDNAEEALNLAWELDDCNKKRQSIQAEMLEEAIAMVEERNLDRDPVILVQGETWHPGLSGLVAGRLKEKYGKPSVAITFAKNEQGVQEGRGSGRSVAGFNMGGAFHDAKDSGLLKAGGGHKMAAGFTISPDNIDAFHAFLNQSCEKQMADVEATDESILDGVLSVNGASVDMLKMLDNHFGPFGQENPEPVFVFTNVRLYSADVVGTDHVRVMIGDWEGGKRMKCIAFKAKDTPLGDAFLQQGYDKPFHITGHLKINEWQGRESAEMHIIDAAYAMEGMDRNALSA
jgi:single-stranded-DNA-specific exonuclease